MEPLTRIDAALRKAAEEKEVPGAVAMAATRNGVMYEGAFGLRNLDTGPAMTVDAVFRIASMTKAVTSVAAMQLVEAGKLQLDEPIGGVVPELASPQVLEGFNASGRPRLRPAQRPITLRHLLTHTAGFGYDTWNPELRRYAEVTRSPPRGGGKLASLQMPLVFDPGERWEYGINTDWVGRAVEAGGEKALDAYFRDHILMPLGMTDTGFALSDAQQGRLVSAHQRQPDGSLKPLAIETPVQREFFSGGGGLYSTARDYLTFLQMLLHNGRFDGAQLLQAETVTMMAQNQIGDINAGIMKTSMPELSNDVDFFPGIPCKWGLGYMISTQPGPSGRSAGTMTWAGLYNSYYWIDPQQRVTGVILTQILPFADARAVRLYGQFEHGVYDALKTRREESR
jgi:methyl acetate hydrolase